MRKEQYFHFRISEKNPQNLVIPSPDASPRGGICIYVEPIPDRNIILWGVAKCHENDNYRKSTAREIAKGRAVGNYLREKRGKPILQNHFAISTANFEYEQVKKIAWAIAEAMHLNDVSDFASLDIDLVNAQADIKEHSF